MLPIIFSLIASLSYGSGDFLAGRTARKLPSALIVLLTQGTQAVLVLMVTLASSQPFMLSALAWGTLGGLANGTAYMLYYRALTIGHAGVVSPLISSSSAIPVLISLLAGNIPNMLVVAGLLAVLLGIIGITYAPKAEANDTIPMCRGVVMLYLWRRPRIVFKPALCFLLALSSAIAFGLAFTIGDHGVKVASESVNWTIWGFQLGALPITMISTLAGKFNWKESIRQGSIIKVLGGIMILNMTGDFLVAYAFRGGVLGIVSVLVSLAPVVTILLSAFFLRERLSLRQKISAAVIIAGTLIIAYGRQ